MGCMRSRDERFNWMKLSPAEQKEVLRLCRQRLLRKLRAQRAAELAKQPKPDDPQGELF